MDIITYMDQPLISIIIATYNSQEYIKNCIDSFLAITYSPIEIIIVDNHSTDTTKQILLTYGEKIHILFLEKNFGYAISNNKGIENARGEYVFIANPDIVVEQNFLEPLIQKMKENQFIAACQPLVYLLQDKKTINLTGKETHFLGFDWIRDYRKTIPPDEGEIFSFSGSGVLLRKSILGRTKTFDPFYFMYYEDTDLSWRIRLFGYKLWFVPASVIYHDYKYIPDKYYQSMKQKIFYNERNRLTTVLKNYNKRTLIFLSPFGICVELGLIIYAFLFGWGFEKIKAYYSIYHNWSYIVRERRFSQKHRRVSDRNITKPFVSSLTFVYFAIPVVNLIVNPLAGLYWFFIRLII
jgi:hypothetical protein